MKVKISNKAMLHHLNLIQTPFSFSLTGKSYRNIKMTFSGAMQLDFAWYGLQERKNMR
jgi:hypothetical protein